MENENKILDAIANLAVSMEVGFSGINSRFESIESRLDSQEKQSKRTYQKQELQNEEIQKLKMSVRRLAESAPVRTWPGRTAILKEDAYPEFEKQGVSARRAMRALRRSGTIQIDTGGKNTVCIYLNGRCQRVIVVKA